MNWSKLNMLTYLYNMILRCQCEVKGRMPGQGCDLAGSNATLDYLFFVSVKSFAFGHSLLSIRSISLSRCPRYVDTVAMVVNQWRIACKARGNNLFTCRSDCTRGNTALPWSRCIGNDFRCMISGTPVGKSVKLPPIGTN